MVAKLRLRTEPKRDSVGVELWSAGPAMMGRREDGQGQFFYEFNLDAVVPPDHLVRRIDAVLDLGWVHKELAPSYSHTGRPSIDPVPARARQPHRHESTDGYPPTTATCHQFLAPDICEARYLISTTRLSNSEAI